MPKSPEEMAAAMIANFKEKTGKSLPQWLVVAGKSKLAKHGELVKHLKTDHGMTHGFANLVAHQYLQAQKGGPVGGDDLVAGQYSGGKADLKPIYDRLIKAVNSLGKDVEISPKKAYVSLRRNKQFGLIQPSTRTRVDLGLNMKGVDPEGRLEASGSFNSMVSHRIKLGAPGDVDAQVKRWLKAAYERS
jgi:predicted transport protein